MAAKDELIAAIRQAPDLTEKDYMELIQVIFETMMGSLFLGMGMDLSTGIPVTTGDAPGGFWIPAPMCRKVHGLEEAGWRGGPPSDSEHEHWVP